MYNWTIFLFISCTSSSGRQRASTLAWFMVDQGDPIDKYDRHAAVRAPSSLISGPLWTKPPTSWQTRLISLSLPLFLAAFFDRLLRNYNCQGCFVFFRPRNSARPSLSLSLSLGPNFLISLQPNLKRKQAEEREREFYKPRVRAASLRRCNFARTLASATTSGLKIKLGAFCRLSRSVCARFYVYVCIVGKGGDEVLVIMARWLICKASSKTVLLKSNIF